MSERVLIVGASSGIGREFSLALAKTKRALTLVARRLEPLESLKQEIQQISDANVEVISADLSQANAGTELLRSCPDADMLVYSAGDGYPGEFASRDLEFDQGLIQLNCLSPMEICHGLITRLKANSSAGDIILISSTMGFQGIPYMAQYSATKGYMINLGEALYHECRSFGINVLTLTPGATDTPAKEKYDVNYDALPINWMQPDRVVRESLQQLGKRAVFIPGKRNRMSVCLSSGLISRGFIQKQLSKLARRTIPNLSKKKEH